MTFEEEYALVCRMIDDTQKKIQNKDQDRFWLEAELEELQYQLRELFQHSLRFVTKGNRKVKSTKI